MYNFSDRFDVPNPRDCKYGLIAIDNEQKRGVYNSVYDKYEQDIKDSFSLFPQGMKVNEMYNDNGLLFNKIWMNGFTSLSTYAGKFRLDIKDINKNTSNWLKSKGVCSSDQVFANRSPDMLHTIFSCFKFYNSNERLVEKKYCNELKLKDLCNINGVLPEWQNDPLEVRYVIRSDVQKHGFPYLFLISGKHIMLDHESMDNMREDVFDNLKSIKEYTDTYKLETVRGLGIWYPYNTLNFSFQDNEISKKIQIKRSIMRMITGVSYIYNYLTYTKRYLENNLFEIIEYNGEETNIISIDEVISRYEPSYKYFRNLVFMTDLA